LALFTRLKMAFCETPKLFSFSQQFATLPYLETVKCNLHNNNVPFRIHFDIVIPSVPMNFRPNISMNLLFHLLLFHMLRAQVQHDPNAFFTLSSHGTKQKLVYNIHFVCFSERSYRVWYEWLTLNFGILRRTFLFCHGILYCVIGPSKEKIGRVANTFDFLAAVFATESR
jgi:hypothetical protein